MRIINAIKIFWICIKNPHPFQKGMFDLVLHIFQTIEKTQGSDTPIYQKIVINSGENTKTLITMWLSKGITPVERAIELAQEVQQLKSEIESYKAQP